MNILILFYKNAKVNIWKTLSLCILCEKLGMFQNDMMSYDSTLFHGTLTNMRKIESRLWSVLSKNPDMMFKVHIF